MKKFIFSVLCLFVFAQAKSDCNNPIYSSTYSRWEMRCDLLRQYGTGVDTQNGWNYYYVTEDLAFSIESYIYDVASDGSAQVYAGVNSTTSPNYFFEHTADGSSSYSWKYGYGYAPTGSTVWVDAYTQKAGVQFLMYW